MAANEPHVDTEGSDVYGTDTLRFVMVGMTGTGKSSLGNSILAWGLLILETIWGVIKRPFVSKTSTESVTVNCKRQNANVLGRKMALVDTPGFFDTKKSMEVTLNELIKCICLVQPGPHAILLVMKIGRSTDEVVRGVELMRKIFGEECMKYLIVVFTGVDSFDDDETLETYIDEMEGPLRKLLEDSDMRYVGFNNKFKPTSDDNKEQVSKLLCMAEKIVNDNGGRCYTNEYLKKAQKLMEEEKNDADKAAQRPEAQELKNEIQETATDEGGCFASDSKVKVQDPTGRVTEKSLEDLSVGDLVQSFDPQTNVVTFSPVYYIIYQGDNERQSTLRELFYRGGDGKERSLRLQRKHLVYATINPGTSTSLASNQPPSFPTMSENVNINDVLWVIDETGQLCPRRVVKIDEVVTTVRHPMTLNHVIIVDDMLASVHMHNEWLLRQATAPLRLLYKISPRLSDFWLSKKAVQAWDYVEHYI